MPPDPRFKCTCPVPCRRLDNLGRRYCGDCEDLQLTEKEKAAREFLKRELEIYNNTPFPNGAAIIYPSFVEGSAPVNCSVWPREVS